MLINVDRNLCIGAAPCVAIAGDVFQLDDEGKAIVIGLSTDDANTQLAAEACPVRAVFLYDDKKTQTYPDPLESPRAYEPEPFEKTLSQLPETTIVSNNPKNGLN